MQPLQMARRRKLQFCQVCGICVAHLPAYCNRFKVCQTCKQKPYVIIDNIKQRFCNKCGQFEAVQKFDDDKRSCRVKLEQHNILRRGGVRKPNTASKNKQLPHTTCTIQKNIQATTPPLQFQTTNNNNNFVNYQETPKFQLQLLQKNQNQINNNYNTGAFIFPKSLNNDLLHEQGSLDSNDKININQQNFKSYFNFQANNVIDSASSDNNNNNQNDDVNQKLLFQNSREIRSDIEASFLEFLGKQVGMQISVDYFAQIRRNKKDADNFVELIKLKYFLGDYTQLQWNCIIAVLELYKSILT
eukprot:TRINITY_DN4564_c2_g1_i1.p3 TRINITY_DN4564_c2_g1~~TRINITY_DN4564_c2_g1_i1.p3  ORF type:complete len:301 (+),score=17.26 TRINITY_DN4564_c2_g1_i1:278-1180(+)